MNVNTSNLSGQKGNNNSDKHLDKPTINLSINKDDDIDILIKNIEGDDFSKMHSNLKKTLNKPSKHKINHESAKKIKQKISKYMSNKNKDIPLKKPNKVDNHKAPAVKEVVVKKHKSRSNVDNRVKNKRVIKHGNSDKVKTQIKSDSQEIMNFNPH
jgi:hypothetical protein